jgi:hypothetical protein
MPDEFIGVVDCLPGPPYSVLTFVVEKTLIGTAPAPRMRVQFIYSDYWPDLEFGRSHQYLVALTIDGSSHVLRGLAQVARTTDRGWAIPVTLEEDRYLFPCSMYGPEPESLTFRRPRPSESLAKADHDEDMINDLKKDGTHTIENGYAYPSKGVLLEHLQAAYAGKSASQIAGECH